MNDHASPPSLVLFENIDAYIADIRRGAVSEHMALDSNTEIYIFYQNFFLQFFDYRFGKDSITGFDEDAKERATRFRLTLQGTDKAAAVICQFEYFCDLRSDLVAGQYFATRDDFLLFHQEYIPELLESIGTWAAADGLKDLAQRSQEAFNNYQAAATRL